MCEIRFAENYHTQTDLKKKCFYNFSCTFLNPNVFSEQMSRWTITTAKKFAWDITRLQRINQSSLYRCDAMQGKQNNFEIENSD